MQGSQFHIAQPSAAEQRPTSDVFKSAAAQGDSIKSRFASSGKFTSSQLETGEDLSAETAAEPDPEPVDGRSLYDRLKEQKDAKQEEWEHKNQFKNQMDHWRLDEDEAGFEDDRLERMRQQEVEAARLRAESAQFYQLARATAVKPAPAAPAPRADALAEKRKRPEMRLPAFKVHKKDAAAPAAAPAAVPAAAPTAAPTAVPAAAPAAEAERPAGSGAGLLPGMDAYDDDDSDEEPSS